MTIPSSSARSTVAEEIAVLMARRGRMTNKQLAEETGIEQSTLGRKLKGTHPFNIDELGAIAAFFDVPITSLFGAPLHGTTERYGVGDDEEISRSVVFAGAA